MKILKYNLSCFLMGCFLMLTNSFQSQNLTVNSSIVSCLDNTYITFGQGIGNQITEYGVKKLEPLLFEAQLSPLFTLQFDKKVPFGFVISPKVLMRMYNAESYPVRTPSYMPFILVYHKMKYPFLSRYHFMKSFFQQKPTFFMSYKFGHHSNGQEGSYYLPNSNNVNFADGNFATDYTEIATSFISKDTLNTKLDVVSARISFEQQVNLNREPSMHDTYYYQKVSMEARLIAFKRLTIVPVVSVMFGRGKFTTKYVFDTYFIYRPFPKKSEAALFAKLYIGPDYYNIKYVNTMRFMSFGILLEPKGLSIYK